MSLFAKLMPIVLTTDANLEAAAKKITDKATADVAALRAKAATSKAQTDKAAKVAAFKAALADYKARLDAEVAPAPTPPTPTV